MVITSENLARKTIEEALPGIRWKPLEAPPESLPDLSGLWRGNQVLVEVKEHRATRVPALVESLSAATLVLRRYLESRPGHPLALAIIPKLTQPTVEKVRSFMSEYAALMGWGLIGRDGSATIHSATLGLDWLKRARGGPKAEIPWRGSSRPFSDLNRWMLKIMLLAEARPGQWGGPRLPRPENVRELQKDAGVAYETARRFVRQFESMGYLRAGRGGLEIVGVRELAREWFREERQVRRPGVPVRWLLGKPKRAGGRWDLLRDAGLAVGGWEACRLHGVLIRGHSYVPAWHTQGNLEEICESAQLVPCEKRDAHLELLQPQFPNSDLKGAVRINGKLVVDIFQAALDVVAWRDRGKEQAEHILEHIVSCQIGS